MKYSNQPKNIKLISPALKLFSIIIQSDIRLVEDSVRING